MLHSWYSSTCKICLAIGKICIFTGKDFGTTSVNVSISSSPSQTSLITGLSAGLLVGIAGILTCIAILIRRHKSSSSTEQPLYDYVAPSQSPTQPERIQVKENNAYGVHPHSNSLTSSLQSNAAYETGSELQENSAYERHSKLASSSSSNATNGFSTIKPHDGTA